ncbi:MAG: hypothetical protein NVSMB23_27440 [Myxococcales bacterium]
MLNPPWGHLALTLMRDPLLVMTFVAVWILLQAWILPHFGVKT